MDGLACGGFVDIGVAFDLRRATAQRVVGCDAANRVASAGQVRGVVESRLTAPTVLYTLSNSGAGVEMGAFRRVVILTLAACWLGCGPALAGKRVAIVIGNSACKDVPRLANPVNDAELVAAMLNSAGVDSVTTKLDVDVIEMQTALRKFRAHHRDADVAVIY